MYKKFLQIPSFLNVKFKASSKDCTTQSLPTIGLNKLEKASKLTQGGGGGYIEKITTGGRQQVQCNR
jgi:hypothetical protein